MKKPNTVVKVGDKFWKLTAVKHEYTDKRSRKHFLWLCECGNTKVVHTGNVVSGNNKSCGCLVKTSQAHRKLPNNGGVINHLILLYKKAARDRNLSFNLTRESFNSLVLSPCYYCKAKDSNIKKTKNCKDGIKCNGIDRVDNSIGYEEGNVVPCCKTCNRAKGTMTKNEFILWAKSVADQWTT